jgi:hypothetical protein
MLRTSVGGMKELGMTIAPAAPPNTPGPISGKSVMLALASGILVSAAGMASDRFLVRLSRSLTVSDVVDGIIAGVLVYLAAAVGSIRYNVLLSRLRAIGYLNDYLRHSLLSLSFSLYRTEYRHALDRAFGAVEQIGREVREGVPENSDLVQESSRVGAIAAAILITLALGALDYATGPSISFHMFYLAPISLAAWFAGMRAGSVISVAAVGTWLAANTLAGMSFSNSKLMAWEITVRLTVFILGTLLLSSLHRALDSNRKLQSLALEAAATDLAHPPLQQAAPREEPQSEDNARPTASAPVSAPRCRRMRSRTEPAP